MATVRMTDTLRSDILGNLKRSFDPRVKSITQQAAEEMDYDAYRDAVKTTLFESWGITREVYDAIPESWGGRREDFRIREINGQDTGIISSYVTVTMGSAIKVPVNIREAYTQLLLTGHRLAPFAAKLAEYHAYLQEVSDEETETVQAARTLLTECSSLKTALELWPAMEQFVPADALARYNTPVERKSTPAPMTELKLDTLNASVVKNRMVGSLYGN